MISKNQIKFVRQLEQKKYRKKEGLFVAEGPKVVGDLLRAGFKAHTIFATSEWESQGQTFQEVSDEELRRVSFLQHPQRVLALFFIPTESVPSVSSLSLALDDVQDPGNLGTIIRIADWFGIDTIYCSENTADAWSPKVVQATMGSIARVNIIYTDLQELISKAQVPVYGTLLDGQDIYTQELSKEGIIVMGNEGNGISAPIRKLINRRLLIPQFHEGPESLNVAIATAITCSEFRRRYPL
ncbi:RNA methyltransferase, TrmH family [Prevotella communis]|jgi:TrmH family RNA methyltransferase|uniref:RNA methyltransferase, TrmH family n=1 Tax=Prevotella communis TaxID=2913614 RepID=A0A1G7YN29_9BACT|nr:RNA methyltransferase [Prevotella communis]MCR5472299.1 RNA methyltransferase [Prevotella sp.]UKK58101.1 RNA methyltransferase [Prevotella communis]SDG97923.1 RNA methyltransferase, TrmH family [Prevotella communis]